MSHYSKPSPKQKQVARLKSKSIICSVTFIRCSSCLLHTDFMFIKSHSEDGLVGEENFAPVASCPPHVPMAPGSMRHCFSGIQFRYLQTILLLALPFEAWINSRLRVEEDTVLPRADSRRWKVVLPVCATWASSTDLQQYQLPKAFHWLWKATRCLAMSQSGTWYPLLTLCYNPTMLKGAELSWWHGLQSDRNVFSATRFTASQGWTWLCGNYSCLCIINQNRFLPPWLRRKSQTKTWMLV